MCKVPLLISKQSHVMVWNKNLCIYRISSLKNCKKFKTEFMFTLKNDKIKNQKAFYHNCNDIVERLLALFRSYFMLPCHYMSIIITFFATCEVIPFTRKFLCAFWNFFLRHFSYKIIWEKVPKLFFLESSNKVVVTK